MIEIISATGERLELEPATILTLEQAAGWLGDGRSPGGFSYPIGFPLTESNNRFLQHAHRPDAARPAWQQSVFLRIENVFYRRCTLSYRVESGQGDGYLKIDGGEANDPLRNLSLADALGDSLVRLDESTPVVGSLADYMNVIAAKPLGSYPLTFFPLRNDLFFEPELAADKVPGLVRQPYLNYYGAGPYNSTGFQMDTALVKGFPVVPFLYLTDVLQRILSGIGYQLTGDWLGDPEVRALTIYNTVAIDAYRGRFEAGHYSVRLRDHVPSISVSDFFKGLRTRFGLFFNYDANARTCSVRRWIDILRDVPQDQEAYRLEGYGLSEPTDQGVSVQEYLDESDELHKDAVTGEVLRPAPLVIGAGGVSEPLSVGTTSMIYEARPIWVAQTKSVSIGGTYWLVPTTRQPGNIADDTYTASDRQPDKNLSWKNGFGFRLLSYRGMQPDAGGNLYPLASSGTHNALMQPVAPTAVGLDLTGNGGAWQQGLRQYYYFRDQTQLLTAGLLWPAASLSRFRLDRPVSVSIDGHRRTYLAERVQAQTPGPDGKLLTRLELYTLPPSLGESPEIQAETVWVELILTALSTVPSVGNLQLGGKTYQKVEVKLWRNKQKTLSSNARIELDLIRIQQSLANGKPLTIDHSQTLRYSVQGPGQVLEARYNNGEVLMTAFGYLALQVRTWNVAATNRYLII